MQRQRKHCDQAAGWVLPGGAVRPGDNTLRHKWSYYSITGAGDKAFAAGADINELRALPSANAARLLAEHGHQAGAFMAQMSKIVIAAVNGFALGGGCEMALACDLRYASSTAKLGQPEINLAIIPGWGGTQRVARVAGVGVAKDLILTGRTVDAEEALRLGLVNAVYEPDELMERVAEAARQLAARSAGALAAAKAAINESLQGEHATNLHAEAREFGDLFGGADAKEGMAAFVEKREPNFG
jgi:enoyl-CoA hydratase